MSNPHKRQVRNRMHDDLVKSAVMLADELKWYGDYFTANEREAVERIVELQQKLIKRLDPLK
jgi:hypothetical protein